MKLTQTENRQIFCSGKLKESNHIPSYYSLSLLLAANFRKQPSTDVFTKEVFLKISQNSQEKTCARVNKEAGLRPLSLLIRDSCTSVFQLTL